MGATYGFGVDVGGTTCKLGLFTSDGTLVEKWEIPTDTSDNGSAILGDIAAAVEAKLAAAGIPKSDVLGVGLGVPGPVLADGTVKRCVNLGWGEVNVERELGDRLGLPVKAGNDANVATLGEMWLGGGKGRRNVVMLTLGTGVGGGIVLDGRILNGTNGAAGEVGHLKVREGEPERCGCGKTGCLEQYASATGIVRLARQRLAADDSPTVLRDLPAPTAKDIADAALAGDRVAGELMEALGRTLGTAAANIACIVDPEVILLGGGVSRAGRVLLEPVERAFRDRAFHACENTRIALAELGNDAGIYGSMKLILD